MELDNTPYDIIATTDRGEKIVVRFLHGDESLQRFMNSMATVRAQSIAAQKRKRRNQTKKRNDEE